MHGWTLTWWWGQTGAMEDPTDGPPLIQPEEMARYEAKWAEERRQLEELVRRAKREGRPLPIDHRALTAEEREENRQANVELYQRVHPIDSLPTWEERMAARRAAMPRSERVLLWPLDKLIAILPPYLDHKPGLIGQVVGRVLQALGLVGVVVIGGFMLITVVVLVTVAWFHGVR